MFAKIFKEFGYFDRRQIVAQPEKSGGLVRKFTDFYSAWHFLYQHRIFHGFFLGCLYTEVVKVNPKTKRIDDNKARNTATRVRLECSPWFKPQQPDEFDRIYHPFGLNSHDQKLDCGASTFEKAIIKLANLVLKHFGAERIEHDPGL